MFGEGLGEPSEFRKRASRRWNAVAGRDGVGPAPAEEPLRCFGDYFVNFGFSTVVRLFVDHVSMQAENPRFHVAAGNHVDDRSDPEA